MDQRLIRLNYTAGANTLDVTAPPSGNIAPPGYYMLFLLNQAGVPSVASFVRLGPAPANQPPSASITSPLGDVTIPAGQSVSFSGTGSDPDGTISAYTWTFPGGSSRIEYAAKPRQHHLLGTGHVRRIAHGQGQRGADQSGGNANRRRA